MKWPALNCYKSCFNLTPPPPPSTMMLHPTTPPPIPPQPSWSVPQITYDKKNVLPAIREVKDLAFQLLNQACHVAGVNLSFHNDEDGAKN